MRTEDKTEQLVSLGLMNNPLLNVITNHLRTLPGSVIAASLFINILEMAMPLAILQIYDRVIPNSSYDTLSIIILGLAIVVIIETILKILRAYIISFQETYKGYMREVSALQDVIKSSPSSLAQFPPTVWLARMDALADRNDQYAGPISIQMIDLPFSLVFLGLIAFIGGAIVIVPTTIILASVIFLYYKGRHLREQLDNQVKQGAKKYDFLNEVLTNIETVKALSIEERMLRRFEALQKDNSITTHKQVSTSGVIQISGNMTSLITMVASLSFGAFLVITNTLTVGALACCTLLINRAVVPIIQGIGLWSEMQNLLILEKRIAPLNELKSDETDTEEILTCDGAITIRDFCVKAQDQSPTPQEKTNMRINPLEIVCFTGDETSGKRFVLMALLGDFKSYDGAIYIDGYNIKSGFENIKDQISYVGPNPTLFDGTLLENLTMFQSDIDLDLIFNTTTMIGLDEQINKLPYGYHTKLGGHNNYTVSPGLAQKIAIARTLIRRTPIMVLENITTNLDKQDIHLIYKGLQSIKGQSTIVISGGSSYLENLCDRIFEFHSGKLNKQHLYPEFQGEA